MTPERFNSLAHLHARSLVREEGRREIAELRASVDEDIDTDVARDRARDARDRRATFRLISPN